MTYHAVPPLHMGTLHGDEEAFLAVLAFGPSLVLTVVVIVMRRRDRAEEHAQQRDPDPDQPTTQRDQPAATEKEG